MSDNYHTPWGADVSDFKAAVMNVPLGELDQAITNLEANKADWTHKHVNPYIVPVYWTSVPTASQILLDYIFTDVPATFFAGLPNSKAEARDAATAQTVISLKKNDVEFGTITFAASGTTGTFAAASDTIFNDGDKLTIQGPGSADATLARIAITLKGIAAGGAAGTTTTTTTTTTTSSSTTTTTTTAP